MFSEKYTALERKFRDRVAQDKECFGLESLFLPNIAPQVPVDFVLIGSEPSTGGGPSKSQVFRSPKNFSGSCEDFILHLCIKEYLCVEGETYYLTDLSKGAMPVKEASKSDPNQRYKAWYPLLRDELKLVSKPSTRIIAIGGKAWDFLSKQKAQQLNGRVLHYSGNANPHRKKIPPHILQTTKCSAKL